MVVARGGFSGLFPDSSSVAYNLALLTSLPNVHLWCDVQLTKDGAGICLRDLKLDNNSDIKDVYGNGEKEYPVNGVLTKGWFSVDFTLNDLANVVGKHKIIFIGFLYINLCCVADAEILIFSFFFPILFWIFIGCF